MDGIERDVVGGEGFGDSRGLVVVGVAGGRADVVVGADGGVENVGDSDVVVEPVGTAIVGVLVGAAFVVVVGTAVVAVTVVVDGSAVTVLGPVVTVSVGVWGTVTVDVEVVGTVPGSCALDVPSSETLAVAEKLALTEITVEFPGEASAGAAAGVSVAPAVLAGSGSGLVVGVSPPVRSPGAKTSLGVSEAALGCNVPASLPATLESDGARVGPHEKVFASFARTGGPESARTTSVVPMAVATNAAATPARVSCRRSRSTDDAVAGRSCRRRIVGSLSGSVTGSSVLSTLCIQLLLSPWNCADRDYRGRHIAVGVAVCQGFE
ncbi:hypothetical protein [Nocardia rhizosphaerihabitans]|uniref:Uncharacterized protein n=1 Tax=Nocardia rhizosphaerihabitans TaxID=1691570 RepID=A0ABQ2KG03_9NOCA|nr:hypothetical protein [Nocardia rhizosphaerihabitans]GGN80503.1 hypothetical protein GCM10011610_29950 [Nocardia rhizosphaerihabitans]